MEIFKTRCSSTPEKAIRLTRLKQWRENPAAKTGVWFASFYDWEDFRYSSTSLPRRKLNQNTAIQFLYVIEEHLRRNPKAICREIVLMTGRKRP